MRVARKLELPYPQEVVFDYVADLRNERSWHPDVETVEKTTDGDVRQGTTFEARYRRFGTVEMLETAENA